MNGHEFAGIDKLEATLWDAADNLSANSKLIASECCMPVLGVTFFHHASNRYNDALRQLAQTIQRSFEDLGL
jgi:type I restriction enzyme M protein